MAAKGHEIFKAVLEQISEGIIIINANDEVTFANKTAEEVRGVRATELIGRSVLLCHNERSRDRVKRALQFLKRDETKAFTRMVVDKKADRYYENTYAAVRDGGGAHLCSFIVTRDITDTRRIEEERARHVQDLQGKVAELTGQFDDLFVSSMASLANTLEAKDPYTSGHSTRVAEIGVKLAEHRFGISPEARQVELAGALHDIGKVGVRETVLDKPGSLTDDEFAHVKEHPVIGERILAPITKLHSVAGIVRHHHERFDGAGYPDGLAGEDIPAASRILAIADTYDAMTSARPYRLAIDPEKAAEEIRKSLGTQFDPHWGHLFLELFYTGSIG